MAIRYHEDLRLPQYLSDRRQQTPTPPTMSATTPEPSERTQDRGDLAIVMGGGGARAAYQAGVLRYLSREFPDLNVPILTGVSAGAINAAHLASHHGTFAQSTKELAQLWGRIQVANVFRSDVRSLGWQALKWGGQLVSGGAAKPSRVRSFLDTQPLREFLTEALHAVRGELTGIRYNLAMGKLKAVALSASNYTTGQSVTWIQGQDIEEWERPYRRSQETTLSVEHVMASSALPILFPAVEIGSSWYGDGGIRLSAPLSPALHLGAKRILAISTRYERSFAEADHPNVVGYPPPAQVAGVLLNAVFLDLLDQDALRLEQMNRLLTHLSPEDANHLNLRHVELVTMRPSVDLGKLANKYEPQLPKTFRFMTRGLGTKQTEAPDFLSLVMFQPDYLQHLIEVGEADAEARKDELAALLSDQESPSVKTPAEHSL